MDFRTQGHETSVQAGNVGIETRIGDNSRSLIGLVFTFGGGTFGNNINARCVRSWFNREAEKLDMGQVYGSGYFTTTVSTPSGWGQFLELCSWPNEAVSLSYIGMGWVDPAGYVWYLGFHWDGALTDGDHFAGGTDPYSNWTSNCVSECRGDLVRPSPGSPGGVEWWRFGFHDPAGIN